MSQATELALPRVVPDKYCDSRTSAMREARRRRTGVTTGAVTRIRRSPYGGFVVVSVSPKALARAIRAADGGVLVRGAHGYGEEYLDER